MSNAKRSPVWRTSSLECAVDQTRAELDALATQKLKCEENRGRFFLLRSAVEDADSLARARFVTTIVVVALAVAAAWFLL